MADMTGYYTFETERLFLRPTHEADAAFILDLLNSPQFRENIGDRKVRTKEDAKAYIQNRMLPQLERQGYSNYTVIRKTDGAKLGTCGLYDREGLEGVDIGFAFLPQYQKQGYAHEAAYRIMDAGIRIFGLKLIKGITSKENTASKNLLLKLGLKPEGTIRLPEDEEELDLYVWRNRE